MVKLGRDPHSWANFEEVRTRHLHINLALLFHEKVARGHVDVHATVLRDGVKEMVLDGKAVAIEYVEVLTLEPENHAVTHKEQVLWTIPRHHPVGFALHIPIPESMQKAGSQPVFRVHYRTTEYSGGIQWLDAKQTAGKKHPFAFTQFECILARTVVPCQDTPSVKATYSIEVRCPTPLVAVCSGENECAPVFHPQDNTISYSYRQRNPIPSYLIALACGALANAPIGPRSRIYAEQCMLDASVHEFRAETEAFIKAAEKVTGVPYNWGRYDIVVLPSSFPYGGMENPNLNFLSASLLAGDRSLTNVLAHEIAHSWSGNLVTNENWSSFWLNEGFTDYIERLILSTVHNSPALRDFEMISGYLDLVKTVKDFEEEGNMEYTKLMPDLEDVDPDDAFSKVPYEKGCLFVRYLEMKAGGPGPMCAWLKAYFTDFARQTITVEQMKQHFLAHFRDTVPAPAVAEIDWDAWLYGAGLPDKKLIDPYRDFDTSLIEDCRKLAAKWKDGDGEACTPHDISKYMAGQTMFFLDELMTEGAPLPASALDRMDALYHLSSSKNVEISVRWLELCLRSHHLAVMPQVEAFLARHGRGLYVNKLFNILSHLDLKAAKRIYNRNRSFYHSYIHSIQDKTLHDPHLEYDLPE